jgi:hypothetical protein
MSWHSYLLLTRPRQVQEQLQAVQAAGVVEQTPNLWQIELGVVRMWHRTLFRSETIGTCANPVRNTWRARVLRRRALRFPFLLRAKAIAPWDMSGLAQPSDRLIAHLLGAHHDATQFVYDLQILRAYPGALEKLRARLDRVLDGSDPQAEWLKDLCVFEGYHSALSEGLDRILAGVDELAPADASDPDVSFFAYLRWCAEQPSTPAATLQALRAGTYHPQHGIRADRRAA